MNKIRAKSARISYQKFYAIVKKIPRGRVATYGQIARMANLPGYARHVGYALAATPNGLAIPWQRVVNAKGEISRRSEPGFDAGQRARLEQEGVRFDSRGRLSLRRFQWHPRHGDGAARSSLVSDLLVKSNPLGELSETS
jgi:methylated-DNA-protein-cysteine methyltransferase-like protein